MLVAAENAKPTRTNVEISFWGNVGRRIENAHRWHWDTHHRIVSTQDVRRVSPDIYCLVDGLVSGMKNQRITTASRATNAILRNAAVRPKLAATTPKSVVPSEAPIPDPVPTMPWAKLKRPVPPVTSAMTSAVSTPNTAPLMASSN